MSFYQCFHTDHGFESRCCHIRGNQSSGLRYALCPSIRQERLNAPPISYRPCTSSSPLSWSRSSFVPSSPRRFREVRRYFTHSSALLTGSYKRDMIGHGHGTTEDSACPADLAEAMRLSTSHCRMIVIKVDRQLDARLIANGVSTQGNSTT